MKKYFKKLFVLLAAATVSLSFCGCAEESKKEYPKPLSNSYAHDFANVLSQSVINDVNSQGKALKDSTSAEVALVTIDTLDGDAIEQYAVELGQEWGVGDKEEDNGVVILLSHQDREIYIAVGYGLEGAIPDSKAGRILDKYMGYLQDDDFSTALHGVYNGVISEVYAEYGLTPPEQTEVLPNTAKEEGPGTFKTILYAAGLIILGVLYVVFFGKSGVRHMYIPMFFGGGRGGRGGGGSGGGFGGGSFGGGGAGRKF